MTKTGAIHDLRDLGYVVRFEWKDESNVYWVDFELYDNLEYGEGPIVFQRRGAPARPDPVSSIEEAQVLVSGNVKWDGCSNWNFVDDCFHFCDGEAIVRFGKALREVYDLAYTHITVDER